MLTKEEAYKWYKLGVRLPDPQGEDYNEDLIRREFEMDWEVEKE